MDRQEVADVFRRHWRPGWGSVSQDEVLYIESIVKRYRPRSFVELGMASGLSGGLIARILDENDGEIFLTLDHDNTFFGDTARENGFLIEQIYTGAGVDIRKHPFKTSLDLDEFGLRFDMAFVDANHQHPWPLIDTLALYPLMTGPKIILHHDLNLYKQQQDAIGIGPKFLFDQFPDSHRNRASANRGNIFYICTTLGVERMQKIAIDAFHLPWSLRTPFNEHGVKAVRSMLLRHYDFALCETFDRCLHKWGKSEPPNDEPSARNWFQTRRR